MPVSERLTLLVEDGGKNDLETAVRKEIASFLNKKNFYITQYTRNKV